MPRRLRDLGEHGFLGRLLPRLHAAGGRVLVGPGDDAAALRSGRRPLLWTIDALAEGTHFRLGWETPAALGRRAFRVNASDLAAMGGTPVAALVAIEAPPSLPASVLGGVMRGLVADARRAGAAVVGSNLAARPAARRHGGAPRRAPGRVVTQAAARPATCSSSPARSAAPGSPCALLRRRRVRRPAVPSRLAAGRALARVAHAAVDVSDGPAPGRGPRGPREQRRDRARRGGVAGRAGVPPRARRGGAGVRRVGQARTTGSSRRCRPAACRRCATSAAGSRPSAACTRGVPPCGWSTRRAGPCGSAGAASTTSADGARRRLARTEPRG
ncbi:MAG: hypothetical protein KIT14_06035 [bacterium]|nr:hypothetical protein [bacterium]